MKLLSEYQEGTKTAQIYVRTFGGFRVVMIDSYFETQKEAFADTENEAENIAEDWVAQ